MKKLVFFLLAAVLSTSIFSQQLKVVENLYKDENSRYAIDYPRVDLNKTLCGLILVELDMPDATFEGDVVYTEYQNGVWWIYMLDGANWLTVKANEYVPLRLEFDPIKIESAATYFMKIEKVQNESLPLIKQYLVIRTEPSYAKIYIDGEYKGQGDVSQILPVQEEHYYRVEAPLYQTFEGKVLLNAELPTELSIKLKPVDCHWVTIRTDKPGDSLFVDDNFVGISPKKLCFEVGRYKIEAMRGVATMERYITITDNLQKDLDLDVFIELKEYDYVDLGLSVKWATCNIGASQPEEYGHCYAWGETMQKNEYNSDNCTTSRDTTIIDISGSATHDVARVTRGKKWRIPTKAEMTELKDKCKWKNIEKNGVLGYEVIGPNGNSIYLPASGNYDGSVRYNANRAGFYWSSTTPTKPGDAYYLYFDVDVYINSADRRYGLAVRPVVD